MAQNTQAKQNVKIINNCNDWLLSFGNNNNTGVTDEIKVGLSILLGANLSTCEELPDKFNGVKPFNECNIIGIINLTQNDNIGGTGDIGIKYINETIKYFSVTQWKNQLSKCICNPSASKWYNLQKTTEMKEMNEKSFQEAIKYRSDTFGTIPNKDWKRVSGCPGSKLMAEYLATEASTSWNSMDKETKVQNIKNFLDLDKRLIPNAHGIIYFNNKKNCIEHIYKWQLNINIDDYLDTYSDGIYIYHGTSGNIILKTQAKYNNGIIEGMSSKLEPEKWTPKKSENYLSSWDVVAPDLKKIFKMDEINLSDI
jgi:hypothetical protein